MKHKLSKNTTTTETVTIFMDHKEVYDLIVETLVEWAEQNVNNDIGELRLEFNNYKAQENLGLSAVFTKTTEIKG